MNLKMNYNSFIKLKDFSKLLDITAEVTSYNQVNDVLDGKLTINGKYLKKDGVTDDFFTEVLPFSVVFNDKNYHIDDIICTDIDTVSVDGRGIDTTFDIEIENFQSLKDVNLSLVQGINIITGRTNQGKSAIIRAIDAAIFNNGSDEQIKTGESSFKIRLNNQT